MSSKSLKNCFWKWQKTEKELKSIEILHIVNGDAVDCNDAEDELFIESCEKQSHVSIMKSWIALDMAIPFPRVA